MSLTSAPATVALAARFVVGFDGRDHRLIRDGEIVFRGPTVVHVGRGYAAPVDRRVDLGNALIGPGFVDLDALADLDSTVLNFDNQPAYAKGRMWSASYADSGPREAFSAEELEFQRRYALVELIRHGITTAAPIAGLHYRAWGETVPEFRAAAAIAGELGLRVYLGPAYRSGVTVVGGDGRFERRWDEARGLDGLAEAEDFAREIDGKHGGRVRAMLAPDRVETCTPALLAATAAAADRLGCPVRLHCAQSLYEFETVGVLRGRTPIEYVGDCGLLRRGSLLPHGIFLGPGDVDLLAASGAAVVHCPIVMARGGHALRSFARLRARGVAVALGTDTYPPDMIENMRLGAYLCRLVEARAEACSAADLYRAATLGGADALGRSDLGRLAPGARADMVVFDLDEARLGQMWDPIQALVLNGSPACVRSVVVDGRFVMEDRRIAGVDFAALRRRAQAQFERLIARYPDWAAGATTPDSLFAPSFAYMDGIKPPEEAD